MTIEVEIAGTGQIAEFPDGTPPEVIQQAMAQFSQAPVQQQAPEGNALVGGLETAATIASSAIAEPLAGLAGGLQTLNPFADPGAGAEAVQATREALTFQPRTQAGQGQLQTVGELLQPVGEFIQELEEGAGEIGFEAAGPLGGAIASALPTLAGELLGLKGIRNTKRFIARQPSEAVSSVLEAGVKNRVPILTTDVVPPTSSLGKFAQRFSEKLGPLGSGPARARQQIARQNVVEELATEFEVAIDSPFAEKIVTSLNKKSARVLENAGIQRNKAVTTLDTFGEVPVSRTIAEIDTQLAKQARLGDKANDALVANLNDIKSSVQGGDFSLVKDIRTEVIDDLRALRRSDDPRATGSTQAVKSAIDKDMIAFARKNDREAASGWLKSNRKFADELDKVKSTELKRILNTGDATPENVLPILKRGKRSELKRLETSLGPKGKAAARTAIIHDVLKKSGFFEGNINPNRLATNLSKFETKQAIDIFFPGKSKAQIAGLEKLLNATRRAQDAAIVPETGVQAIQGATLAATGAGLASNPLLTAGVGGTLAVIAKGYESNAFRSLLTRLGKSKAGSKIETGILESAVPSVIAAQQASRKQEEQTQ